MTAFNHRFDATVLREYDIRGIVGRTLKPEDAFAIGRCFGSIVVREGGKIVAVGCDGRLSSPDLEPQLVAGLRACGLEVLRVGTCPTPMLYYASYALHADGAAMVTGSHNPPDYNGFKMMLGKKPFFGPQIQEIGRMAAEGDVVPVSIEGSDRHVDLAEDYVARMLRDYDGGDRRLKVVWTGNGSGGDITKKLAERLPGEHFVINATIDGNFPNHHPDPTVAKSLEQIIAEVKREGADLGIAFDGDADRIGVVDDEGHFLFGDQLLIVLARDVLDQHPGAIIIADVKASQVFFDEVERAGGKPLMWKTGHSLIKSKMAETGAPLAGEMSGHTFFADEWYGFDDAPYTAVRLLGIVARMTQKLSDVRKALPQPLNTPELRFDCPEDRKFAIVQEVKDRLSAAGAQVNDVDGVRVLTADGWWLLRASNTQAVLVARAEAATEAGLERLEAEIAGQLQASGLPAPDFREPASGTENPRPGSVVAAPSLHGHNALRHLGTRHLLVALVAFLIIAPLIAVSLPGSALVQLLFTGLVVTTAGVGGGRSWLPLNLFLTAIWIVTSWTDVLLHWSPWISFVSHLALIALLIVSIRVILRGIFGTSAVTIDTISGAICAYLLLGIGFAALYQVLELWDPAAFSSRLDRDGLGWVGALYFSLVTLSTLGYGDIVPRHPAAMLWSAAEAVTGLFYVAILIARLVSQWQHPPRSR